MDKKAKNLTAIVGGVSSVAMLSSCMETQKSYDNWLATDGAAGRINLDAVNDAFNNSKGTTDFQKRVNEIYEGDNIVLVKVEEKGNGQKIVSGFEDLDGNSQLNEASDDKLFSFTIGEDSYTLQGHGSNGYYSHNHYHGGGNGFFLGYLMASSFNRPYTPSAYETRTIRSERSNYRSSSAYTTQKSNNATFMNTQKANNPQAFNNAKSSAKRSSYQTKSASKFGGSKSSGSKSTGAKSSGGSKGASGGQ